MQRVAHLMWMEQDAEFNRLMVVVGNDPAFELLRWPRAIAFQQAIEKAQAQARPAPKADNDNQDEAALLRKAAAALSTEGKVSE